MQFSRHSLQAYARVFLQYQILFKVNQMSIKTYVEKEMLLSLSQCEIRMFY